MAATRARIKGFVSFAQQARPLDGSSTRHARPYTEWVANPAAAAPNTWTCARCEVTVSFSPDVEDTGMPSTWIDEDGELYCLGCRREIAGEQGVAAVDEDSSDQTKLQVRSQARIEFEIKRDPERQDNQIAKACGTSAMSVRKARARLGLDPHTPS